MHISQIKNKRFFHDMRRTQHDSIQLKLLNKTEKVAKEWKIKIKL